MVYMLNEKSIAKSPSIYTSREVMDKFVKAAVRASVSGLKNIRIHESIGTNLYNIELAENYLIYNWLNDDSVDADLKNRFRQLSVSTPLLTNQELDEFDLFERSEFHLEFDEDRIQVFGIGAAYLYDKLSASFETS